MGSENEVPILDFSESIRVKLAEGGEGWKEMSKKVKEAFESHGCFLIRCDDISNDLHDEFFANVKSLFDLPEETKKKFYSPRAYRGYTAKTRVIPYSESFGIDNDRNPETALQDFIHLMWPEGNPTLNAALSSYTSKARELSSLILKLVVEAFELPQHYNLDVEELNRYNDARMTKYSTSEETKGSDIGLVTHTDKGTISFISDNGVQGLQLLPKTGNWVDVNIPTNGFVVVVGDILQAWTNGRLEAATHRVVAKDEVRYAFVFFAVPREGIIIDGPSELVDDENYPRRYRPFNYDEYVHYQHSTGTQESPLEKFAGI
ncbi:probable 2-oxoglutarate-dependent dioxygenase AOP1 [Vicia villosa]|uniref:probable 2-oxoglutarate-dependent dioxygenase AOP1 n=1 Tax=Vicia villosa TaxID=3911 RepID=UPI00273CEB53|nr:probable 2-oxoglutarate-dependent dioxygenase AOP1 [Vicia villosa]